VSLAGDRAYSDLTVLTGAPPAAAGSALTGYGWAAGHSKQVVYLDAGQHVRELSVTPGSQWAAADLTMLTGAPPTAAGSALSGYRSQTDLTTLYGMLRAQLLSRHFAVGRYFRADHLSWYNTLGVVHQSGSATPPTGNDRYHQCLWSANQSPNEAVVVMPGSVYPDANTLGTLPADTGLFERWRVGDHQRANPLMASGQLMACLAVETWLGIPGSKAILARLLATTKSLFKYTTPPYDGYILRWDPATSDHWATGPAENADYQVTDCCDFLTDPDNPGQFLYCTPQDDPRYVPYMQQSAFTHLPSGSNATNDPRTTYQNARMFSLDMTRYWEPSMDELTGLIAGYSFVSTVVSDPGIQAEVSDQASRLARYLSANAYILVRPGGGFVAQGAAGIAPALEFPFGRVFSRITGSAHPAQTDFEGALQNANMWAPFSAAFAGITLTGPITGPLVGLLLSFLAPVTGDLLGLLITAVGGPGTLVSLLEGGGALKALLLYQASEAFDVYSWPGLAPSTPGYWGQAAKNGEQTSFAVAYLLSQVPPLQRFTAWLWASGRAGTGYALNFPPFLGLTALNDSDQTVRNGYLDWLSARRAIDPPWPGDDAQSGLTTNSDAFASAVAVMLGSGQAEQQKLISLLWALATEFDEKRGNSLGVYDDAIKHGGQHVVTESVSPALNFMSALALAWYYSKTMADAGTPLPLSLGFPAPPAAGATLPAATIPAAVVNAIYGQSPAQVIPIGIQAQMGSWPLPDPLPGELDVFAAPAPGKPDVSAGNALPVTWLYSEPRSFFGNLWGASGTDTIGAGKTVTGSGCSVLGVKLQMIDRQGNPLGVSGASTTWAAPNTASGPQLWPSPAAVDSGPLGLAAGARILSIGANPANPADETVTVQWWYQPLRACRYRIAYLVQGSSCAL
jgi:hypothetical protein